MKIKDKKVPGIDMTVRNEKDVNNNKYFRTLPNFFNSLAGLSFLPESKKGKDIKDIFKGGF